MTRAFRVFVSSTFADFQREREVLHSGVLPKLADPDDSPNQPLDRQSVVETAGFHLTIARFRPDPRGKLCF
jgi:hypothetical protein